jgi:dephospho-CoA kinase
VTNKKSKIPFRIGLTGGIASGKSTVADLFEDLGIQIIDTDIIAKELVQRGQPALKEIREKFGDSVIGSDGHLNRIAMRSTIFSNEDARLSLEKILHPKISIETKRKANNAGGKYQIIVVPLLVKSTLRDFVDRVLVVDCSKEVQIKRLIERDNESITQAARIIAAQTSRKSYLEIADDIIQNNQGTNAIQIKVAELHQRYCRLSSN